MLLLDMNLRLLSLNLVCHDGGFAIVTVAAVGVFIVVFPAAIVAVVEMNLPFLSLGLVDQD
jgi:hypothetical protein